MSPPSDSGIPGGRSGPSPDTDPDRVDPYESLYRLSDSDPGVGQKPTPRHYESSMSRPAETREGQFNWLYREEPDPATAPPARPPVAPLPVAQPAPYAAPRVAPPPRPPLPPPPATAIPVEPRRRRSPVPILLVLLLLAVAGGVSAGFWISRNPETPARASRPVTPVSTATEPAASGAPTPTLVSDVPSAAEASCQAPPATDDAGRPVRYVPSQLFDGDPSTAWRCNGSGVDETVTFSFDEPVIISTVSMINGYTKVDPSSGANRYDEYRRVTGVRWTFSDHSSVKQKLADEVQTPQTKTFDPRQTSEVTLTITRSSKPGSKAKTRDAVLISEVAFGR